MAKANRHFLEDKNGPVDNIIMTCLKPKVGSGNLLEDTPKHLPADEAPFDMSKISLQDLLKLFLRVQHTS